MKLNIYYYITLKSNYNALNDLFIINQLKFKLQIELQLNINSIDLTLIALTHTTVRWF